MTRDASIGARPPAAAAVRDLRQRLRRLSPGAIGVLTRDMSTLARTGALPIHAATLLRGDPMMDSLPLLLEDRVG